MGMKRESLKGMKTFHMRLKNKGFLMIATTTIITAMLASFLISYKLSINRGKKVAALLRKNQKTNKLENMKIFTYDELYRIDCAINRGEYKNANEYVTKNPEGKIWLLNDKTRISDNGYFISRMFYSGNKVRKSCFYNIKKGSNRSFKELIQRELYRDSILPQSIYVELKKEYLIEGKNKKIVTKALIKLEYEVKNRDATNPQKEILKEFETSLEDI